LVRYNPDADRNAAIKPLRIKEEQPGGLIGLLKWLRARGGVFWFTFLGSIATVVALFIVFIPLARSQGQLDFRAPPDMAIAATVDKTAVSSGDTLVFTISHENIGDSEAGAVTIDITLPDALTAVSVVPRTPACSQATDLERFSSLGLGEITGEPGGLMKCLMGTRSGGSAGTIVLEAKVGEVPSGTVLTTDILVTTEQTRGLKKPETLLDNNTDVITVTVN
jgi:uncharacterized repeat protein (TIGR01451 family)